MSIRDTLTRLLRLPRQQQLDAEMSDELRLHVDMQAEENVRRGMSSDEARREALLRFGGLQQTEEACRDVRALPWLQSVCRDVGFTLRTLRKSSVFTLASVFILALGIGATTAIFSVIDGVLLAPLPYPDADRIVMLRSVNEDRRQQMVSVVDFADWQEQCRSFDGMALFHSRRVDLRGDSQTERINGLVTTSDFFDVMGIEPSLGRAISEEEVRQQASVIVLSEDLWRRRFKSDVQLVGRTIDVNSWRLSHPQTGPVPQTVVGIVGGESRFVPVTDYVDHQRFGVDERVDMWMPLRFSEQERTRRDWRNYYHAVARLADGVSIGQAEQEIQAVSERLAEEYPETNAGWSVELVPLSDMIVGDVRPTLWLLLAAVGFLLVIALANVASLLLVRGVARQQELSVRAALGASRSRLLRQLITESLVLGLLSGAVGIGFAWAGVVVLKQLAPPELPRIDEIGVDLRVLGAALSVSLLTGTLVGALPAWIVTGPAPVTFLKAGARTASSSRTQRFILNGLAAGSVAVALVLLIGAGLLQQSLARVLGIDPGFNRQRVLSMTVSLPEAQYEWQRNSTFCHEVVDRVNVLPGVIRAGAIRGVPLEETRFDVYVFVEGSPNVPLVQRPLARIRVIGPGYFETMEIPLIAGRFFDERDDVGEIGHTDAILINQTMAEQFWPGEEALHRRIRLASSDYEPSEVIGIVRDVRYERLEEPPRPEVYYPDALFPQDTISLVVRTELDPNSLAAMIHQEVRRIQPDVIVTGVRTMDEVVDASVADRRFAAVLLTAFSLVAFVLAVAGTYGVVACSVAERKRELGIRLALGAQPGKVLVMIVRQGVVLCLTGLVIGLGLAWAGTRLLNAFLWGVEPTDLRTYLLATLLLAGVSTAASLFPAWRAVRANPTMVLREE